MDAVRRVFENFDALQPDASMPRAEKDPTRYDNVARGESKTPVTKFCLNPSLVNF